MAALRQPSECFSPDRAPRYAVTSMAYTVVGDRAYVSRTRGTE